MGTLFQDLRFAWRTLGNRLGFTAVLLVSLALGVGVNSAVFGVFYAVFLSPPPYKLADRIVVLQPTYRMESGDSNSSPLWSYPLYQEFAARVRSLRSAAYWGNHFNLSQGRSPERISMEFVTAGYFDVLRVQPALGRSFSTEEDVTPGSHPVAILSHGLWKAQFGANPAVVGKRVRLNDISLEVVGVMPAGFDGLTGQAQLWVPMAMAPELTFRSRLTNPGASWASVIGRLEDGVALEQASEEMKRLATAVSAVLPHDALPPGTTLNFSARILQEARVDPSLRAPLAVLLTAVSFVLLIACANVANLLLSRGISREREYGLRLAVGAGPGRLLRQLLTESLLLAVLGGAAGMILSWWSLDLLRALRPAPLQRFLENGEGASGLAVAAYSLLVILMTGVLCGLLPAWRASRTDPWISLKGQPDPKEWKLSRLAGLGIRRALVVGQVAMALPLLIGAGLTVRSFLLQRSVRLGFAPRNVLTAKISLPRRGSGPDPAAIYGNLESRMTSEPGVQAAGLAYCLPVTGGCDLTELQVSGRELLQKPVVIVNLVSGGFFRALQVPVAKGRVFSDSDDSRSSRVAMVSASLARRLWPDRDPVGERIRLGLGWPEGDYAQVIGIAGDVRYGPLGQPASDAVYLPFTQMAYEETLLALRHDIDTRRLGPILRARLAQVDPTLPLYDVATLEERVATSISQARFSAILLGVFAAVGLILAAVGVYGVMAFAVSLRAREMGIRVALGATPRSVLGLVLRDGMILAGVGIAAGLAVSLAGARLLEGDLYGLSPLDPTTYVLFTAFMAAAAAAACLVPAVRVLRANPLTALREE